MSAGTIVGVVFSVGEPSKPTAMRAEMTGDVVSDYRNHVISEEEVLFRVLEPAQFLKFFELEENEETLIAVVLWLCESYDTYRPRPAWSIDDLRRPANPSLN